MPLPEPVRVPHLTAFAQEQLGWSLLPNQADILDRFAAGPFEQLILQIGRRSGKSMLADVIALYDALYREHLSQPPYLVPGQQRTIAIVSTREQQAADHIKELSRLIHRNPTLELMLARENREQIEFKNGSVIRTYPCSARVIRGTALSSVILDEFGHFEDVERSNSAGDLVLQAVEPCLLQFRGQGWLIVISTPLFKDTAFGHLVDQARSGEFPEQLYIHRTTEEMRPDLAQFLQKIRRRDPDGYALEYDAQFSDGVGSYLRAESVIGCKRLTNILPPQTGLRYIAALDPAFSLDHFAMAIGHKEPSDGRAILDGVWTWFRQGYEATLNEVQSLAQAYQVADLTTDQSSVQAIQEGLAKRHIPCTYVPWTNESKAGAFGRLKLCLDNRTVELPNDPELANELYGLQARPTPAGFTRIAARPGGHDDRAIVVASVVDRLMRPDEVVVIFAGDTESKDAGWWPTAVTPSLLN